MRNNLLRKGLVVGTILLFIGVSIVSGINVITIKNPKPLNRAWLYVGGNGTGNYTTIQSAINAANPGDTVFVFGGTYYEHVVVSKTIDLIGENRDTTVIDGGLIGVVIYVSSDGITISGFTVQNGDNGISLSSSSNNTIMGNNASNNVYGIYLDSSNNNTIIGNNVSNNYEGISLFYFSNNNTVTGNNASNNDDGIILFSFSNNNTITGNNVNSNNDLGIFLASSSNNTIIGNNVANNIEGISLFSSGNNSIMGNDASNNDEGIRLGSSSNNTVMGNNAANNGDGIYLFLSSNNIIMGNNASNNGYGIRLFSSNINNAIMGNNVSNNVYGIRLGPSGENNHLYHNNIMSNTQNALDLGRNIWDNGYPSGGSYWSDYTGIDADGDGIGDTPYNIPEGSNQDHYPFMEPNGWLVEPSILFNIQGGLRVKLKIINNGTEDANGVPWRIHVEGGILKRINETKNGTIDISAGEFETVGTEMLFGLGPIEITAKVADEEITVAGTQIIIVSIIW